MAVKIGIVGLGLIGGSMAKAIKEMTLHEVYGYDILQSTMLDAAAENAIDGTLDSSTLSECDIVIISLYPQAAVEYVSSNASAFRKGSVVIDCTGTKRIICETLEPIAKENGFYFLGGHPMAGTQFWGFQASRPSLFKGASMILTPNGTDADILDRVRALFFDIGFGEITFTTPEEHDRIIAYTSQLAHVVSNAYIKSPTALMRKGFSAGSYKDMTRVAKLNENMWTELFLENRDFLVEEIDLLIENLSKYSKALKENSEAELRQLLKDGKDTKKQAG